MIEDKPKQPKEKEAPSKDSMEALYEISESLKLIASYFEHKLQKEKGRRA